MTDTATAPATNTEHRHAARFATHKALAFVQILRHDYPDDVVIQGVTDNLKTVLSTIRGRYGLSTEQQGERLETAIATLTDSSVALGDSGQVNDTERLHLIGYAMNAIATAIGRLTVATSNLAASANEEDPDADGGMA